MPIKPYIFLLLFSLATTLVVGQSYSANIRKLSIQDGLSNRYVRNTFQDSKGFIWLATNYGLNRYDGYNFKFFTKETHGLSSNVVSNIYEDGDTCLWITYLDGVKGKPLDKVDILNLNSLEIISFERKLLYAAPFKLFPKLLNMRCLPFRPGIYGHFCPLPEMIAALRDRMMVMKASRWQRVV